MSRTCDYELHGWDAEGKPLPEELTEEIFDILDKIGTDDCTNEPITKDAYITTFQSETQGASGEVDDALKDFSVKHPDALLELEFLCRDEDIHSRTRYKNGEVEAVNAIITFPPFQRLRLPPSA